MLVKVNLNEILEFVQNGEDCKVEINKDGEAYTLSTNAGGYDDTILTQYFEVDDYKECENGQGYIEWLEDCFQNELEADDEVIKLELVK